MPKGKLTKPFDESLAEKLAKKRNAINYSLLGFPALIQRLHDFFSTLPDHRRGRNVSKNFNDATMGAFALFHTQSPSFLSYQERMRESEGKDNAQSLFGIVDLLSDNHIRDLIDEVSPEQIFPFLIELIGDLEALGYLDLFRSYNKNLLLGVDGTQFFRSKKICCQSCCQQRSVSEKSKKETVSYHHNAVMAAFVYPGHDQMISLPPEFIIQQDGTEKQDCELNATRRWLNKFGSTFAAQKVTI